MLSPILEELSKEFTNINFIKINIDHNQEVASKFNVRSIPTVYLFKDSKIVSYFVGFKNKDQIIEFLKEVK
jgi:thioredoxin 1